MSCSIDQAKARLRSLPYDREKFIERCRTARKAMQRINPDLFLKEPDLMLSAHPDYRFMTPNKRTELFKNTYAAQYSLLYRQSVNHVDHEKMTGLMRSATRYLKRADSQITEISKEYSALWAQRQFADSLGLPYDFYINTAFESHSNVQRKRIPRPNQLVTGAGAGIVLNHILDKSDKFLGLNKNVSYLGAYREEFYIGLPSQNKHRNDVFNWMRSEHAVRFAVANSLIPHEKILDKFGDYALESAQSAILSDNSYYKSFSILDRSELYPGCYLLPLAFTETNDVCSNCLFSKNCNLMQNEYLSARKNGNKAINDYVIRKRYKQNMRQRKKRAKLSSPIS